MGWVDKLITQIIGFVILALIFKKLFDTVDQIRDNHRKKHAILKTELEVARARRALLVRLAWERHQLRKEQQRYYNEELVDDMGVVPLSFNLTTLSTGEEEWVIAMEREGNRHGDRVVNEQNQTLSTAGTHRHE